VIVEEEMATKTAQSYEVDYKEAVKAIQRLEKKLTAIKNKVSAGAQSEIKGQLEVMKKCEMFCGSGRKKMSKTYT
jgi:filamentous hemagglutinin family protein